MFGRSVGKGARSWGLALWLGTAGVAVATSGCGPAEQTAHEARRAELSGDSPLIEIFRAAERDSGVPAEMLAAIAYVQTGLGVRTNPESYGAATEHDGHEHAPPEWGVMAIGAGALTSVEVGATLIGSSPQRVATEDRDNVRAAAALMKTAAHARGAGGAPDLDAWWPAVEAFGGDALLAEVKRVLASGFSARDAQGFRVEVEAIGSDGELGVVQLGVGYPGALWNPAYSGNYTNANRGAAQINYIIIHTMQGSYAGTISWFKNPSAKVSAHYNVRSSDGQITQMVDDRDIGWHVACFNSESIGIEHEGYVSDPGKWYTDAMYKSSAKLSYWLSKQYGIPIDKGHIMGHGEAPDCSSHTDPGSGWNWTKYMAMVKNDGCEPKTEVCNGKDDDCDGNVDEGEICNAKPKGTLDGTKCDRLWGWAQDPDTKAKAIDVHLYFGGPAGSGAKGHKLTADEHRDDLCTALGTCKHAFELAPPLSLFDGKDHAIHAYAIDSEGGPNAQLSKSPGTFNCTADLPQGVRRHVTNPDSLAAWKLDLFWDLLPLSDEQIATLSEEDALPAAPELVQADDGSPEVWLVDGKWRRHVPDPKVMDAWGFAFTDVTAVTAAKVQALKLGPPLLARPILVKSSDGKVDIIDAPMPMDIPPGPGSGGASGVGGGSSSGGSSAEPKQKSRVFDGESEGCACRAAGGSSPSGSWLWLLGALALLRRRRRVTGRARRAR